MLQLPSPHAHLPPTLQDVKAELAGAPVTFLGRLSGRELAAAYASADMFVMPSESETLGNVVGEVRLLLRLLLVCALLRLTCCWLWTAFRKSL